MPTTVSHEGHVAVLTLDYPDNFNALSTALVRDVRAALAEIKASPARAIVITAKGKFFSAGANIHDLFAGGWMSGKANAEDPIALFETLATHPLTIIAALTAPALGGGFELSLCCDLAVAAPEVYFAAPEAGLGVIPNTALALLAPIVGRRRAADIALTRRRVMADEALAIGLVSAVVPATEVVATAVAMAGRIVDTAAPGALTAIKAGLARHEPVDWAEIRASLARLPQDEWKEGLGAFAEKRKPDFARFWVR